MLRFMFYPEISKNNIRYFWRLVYLNIHVADFNYSAGSSWLQGYRLYAGPHINRVQDAM